MRIFIVTFSRRPEVGETVLLQRPAPGKHHAFLQDNATVRPVPGTRGHHHGRVHADGVAAVGIARAGQRAGQQGCESDAKQEESKCTQRRNSEKQKKKNHKNLFRTDLNDYEIVYTPAAYVIIIMMTRPRVCDPT